jgi:glycosyltransferase involved in cell wall biosynthesis
MKLNYVPREKRKKILLICDDIRMTSGVSTVAREIVIGTAHHFNWVNVGGAIKHPDIGKKLDLNDATNTVAEIPDSSVYIYPVDGYGSPEIIRQLLKVEKPDALMFFTDPRYFIWLFRMEHEIRQQIPMIYLNIWDDLPYPMYNKSYYESCDTLMAISKQTENVNRTVLGEKANEKIIKYIPHGINEKYFFPITPDKPEWLALEKFKKEVFGEKKYKFNLLYNARNIRRKSVPDLMLAWKIFIDGLEESEAKLCNLMLHTQTIDENGTNLLAVSDMLYGKDSKYNIIFSENKFDVTMMNLLYNICDATVLPSSNEGWGLSLTESMICGKPIIATVTGGMQDQMRFEDENGEWIKFTEKFGSNHRGKYKKCGKWAIPVFPSNISLIGSVPTPYIYDDRISPHDLAEAISSMYKLKTESPEYYETMGEEAHKWVMSDESQMTAKNMCKNVINTINETLTTFEPKYRWELIETEISDQPKHYVKYPIAC